MTKPQCSINKCNNTHHARGWCEKHYLRWKRHGDPEKTLVFSTPEQAFASRVAKNGDSGCWLWGGYKNMAGYGSLKVDGKMTRAHRYSWELHNGPIPDGMHVLHRCDNPPCVNPDHLWLGTDADNAADRAAKGRSNPPKGDAHWNAKLTEPDMYAIRADTRILREIATDYGVTPSTISFIKHRKTWRHII